MTYPLVRPTKVATPLFFGRRFLRKAHISTEPKLKRTPPAALKENFRIDFLVSKLDLRISEFFLIGNFA